VNNTFASTEEANVISFPSKINGDVVVVGDFTANNCIVGSTNLITEIIDLQGRLNTSLETKQDNIIATTELTCNSITVTNTTPIENNELTSKIYVDNGLSEKQYNIVSSIDLTCNSITVTNTTPIENDELTSKIYVDTRLLEKQDNIISTTDLTCNLISTQLGSVGTTNSINGFEFTRSFNNQIQLNSGFDSNGIKTNIILYNRDTGGCLLNGKSQLFLQAGNVLHNITESGFKIGSESTATEELDVTGNILASGSIIGSSAIINGVNIGSGLSSLQTQVNGKQDILQAGTNITIDENNIISSSSITQEDLDLKQNILQAGTNITVDENNMISSSSITQEDLDLKQNILIAGTNIIIDENNIISSSSIIQKDLDLNNRHCRQLVI
jgi:hypothetical protein